MNKKRLTDGYKFKGFKTMQMIQGVDLDPYARIIKLKRLQKKVYAAVVENIIELIMIRRLNWQGIFRAEI
jgi:hypothetical protein